MLWPYWFLKTCNVFDSIRVWCPLRQREIFCIKSYLCCLLIDAKSSGSYSPSYPHMLKFILLPRTRFISGFIRPTRLTYMVVSCFVTIVDPQHLASRPCPLHVGLHFRNLVIYCSLSVGLIWMQIKFCSCYKYLMISIHRWISRFCFIFISQIVLQLLLVIQYAVNVALIRSNSNIIVLIRTRDIFSYINVTSKDKSLCWMNTVLIITVSLCNAT